MIHIVPGDPVEQMLGEGAAPGEIVQLRHSLGLDQPLLTQYGHYLKRLARGDLGQSFKFQAPVRQIIFDRYPATLSLAFPALAVCAAIANPGRYPCRIPPRTICQTALSAYSRCSDSRFPGISPSARC